MKNTQNPNSLTSLSGTSTDPIDTLERIVTWPANTNSDPDAMAEALDSIQQLAYDALNSFRSEAPVAGTNKELATVLLQYRPIIAGQDTYGPFLMLGDFRCAMPSPNAAHVISHLINKGLSHCGQRDCPCVPVDPPHDS